MKGGGGELNREIGGFEGENWGLGGGGMVVDDGCDLKCCYLRLRGVDGIYICRKPHAPHHKHCS